jgi:hypothetical protein
MSVLGRALAALCVSGVIALALTMRGDTPVAPSAITEGVRNPAKSSGVASARLSGTVEGEPLHNASRAVSVRKRADAIARAQVWRTPKTPIARAALGHDPAASSQVDCRFTISDLGGTTPKFDCLLESGKEVRIKYGSGGEIPAEAAATRLLAALGFGADTVALVERLRCYGCPKQPFVTTKVVEATRTRPLFEHAIDHGEYEDFEWVAMEQKFWARPIEAPGKKGWAFSELDMVDASKGGAPRAQVDALRLIAVFLAHWDNKAENQRLVCLSRTWVDDTPCHEPFLLLQDLGSTFGPKRVDLDAWEKSTLWEHRAMCTISMRHLPYEGATFGSVRVSERGRQFLADLLGDLTDAQLTALFSGARFDTHSGLLTPTRPVSEWVRVFRKRMHAITEGPPCPDA